MYDYRRFNFCSSFQNGVDGVGTHAVNSWQSKVVFFSYLENFLYVITSDYAWFYEIKKFLDILRVLYLRPWKGRAP
ncbi:hypothetical protein [Citrobacter freundii]|uniref:Uncharacterized protein n=1 Tax=Citrobacter freundii TaxID=546 RepID=A0A7G2IQM3_CITFR|nr:hypothetical protein [Citrobacter freundii]